MTPDAPEPASFAASAGSVIAAVVGEVERATKNFPTWPTDPLHALGVLQEEVGELAKEVMQMTYEPHKSSREAVGREAMQTAAMAVRFLMSLDRYDYERRPQHSQNRAGQRRRERESIFMSTETENKPDAAVCCTGVVGDERKRRTKSGAGGGAELTRAMQDALTAMKDHGDTEYKNYRWNRGVMARAEWRNAAVTAEAPRVLTLDALGRRGLVEEYNEVKYCGHGEYDDWQCWRLVAVGGEDARSHEGSSPTVRIRDDAPPTP